MSGERPSDGADRLRRDALAITAAGLGVRVAVALLVWGRVPPIADGLYYDTLARRLANGLGYTWAWPDGTVTHAAHYPVGYPAFVASIYRVLGADPGWAMLGNAVVGALAVLAAHRLAARRGTRREAAIAALLVAVHPDLVSYTPALMTEGVAAALVTTFAWLGVRLAERRTVGRAVLAALALAAATYVRPQCIVLGALLPIALARGASTRDRWRAGALGGVAVLALALLAVAPWSARNCARMGRCAFVSVNDGWNLLIGTDVDARGGWAEVKVPAECASIEDEAAKNTCFGDAARRAILAHPGDWLALAPEKLAVTFNYGGAGAWYLHAANEDVLSGAGKRVLGGISVVFERLTLAGALVAVARLLLARLRATGSRAAGLGVSCAVAGAAWCFFPALAWLGVVALVASLTVAVAVLEWDAVPPIARAAWVVVGATAATHAVFFGSGRYGLVTFPLVTALSAFQARFRADPARAARSAREF